MIFNAFSRGYRYWVLMFEVFLYPIYFTFAISHLIYKIHKEKTVNWSSVTLIGKYLIFFILLFLLFIILGIFSNDITSSGSNINF